MYYVVFPRADEMIHLSYRHYIDETPTTVNVMFVGSGSGTEIHIKHSEFGDGRDGSDRQTRAAQMWSERLPVLADYLNTRPGSYAARPRGAGPFPAVLLLHDAFGLNRSMRVLADSIARAGYYTLAVDMFRGDVTGDVTEAQRFAAIVNSEDAITAAVRGFDALQKNPHVIAGQGSVFGLGFGADVALAVAAANSKVSACVAWYGDGLRDESLYRRISCPVLTVFGDPNVDQPRAELAGQNQSLVQAGVRAETMVVQAAPRFADTGYGADYNASAATQAWRRSLGFLDTQRRR